MLMMQFETNFLLGLDLTRIQIKILERNVRNLMEYKHRDFLKNRIFETKSLLKVYPEYGKIVSQHNSIDDCSVCYTPNRVIKCSRCVTKLCRGCVARMYEFSDDDDGTTLVCPGCRLTTDLWIGSAFYNGTKGKCYRHSFTRNTIEYNFGY